MWRRGRSTAVDRLVLVSLAVGELELLLPSVGAMTSRQCWDQPSAACDACLDSATNKRETRSTEKSVDSRINLPVSETQESVICVALQSCASAPHPLPPSSETVTHDLKPSAHTTPSPNIRFSAPSPITNGLFLKPQTSHSSAHCATQLDHATLRHLGRHAHRRP